MAEILADRFVPGGAGWIDLATGSPVRLHVRRRHEGSDSLVWHDRCATLSMLRHPVLNDLIDYGNIDGHRLFEAYDVRAPLSDGDSAPMLLSHAAQIP